VSSFGLDGRTALVTGASRGIGRGIALAYADAGADVALLARDAATLAEVAAEVEARRRAVVPPTSPTSRPCRPRSPTRARAGHVDVLVNNAGGNSFAAARGHALRLAEDDALNLDSTVRHPGVAAAPIGAGASSSTSRRSRACAVRHDEPLHPRRRRPSSRHQSLALRRRGRDRVNARAR
jgi:NAD(P)-dependent dehydrogenase (short-subunit alcohol dehydrogenase family)